MSGRANSKTALASKADFRSGLKGVTPVKAKKLTSVEERKTSGLVNKLATPRTEGGELKTSKFSAFDKQVLELLGERFVAYNENLLAASANQIKQREKNDLENSIQSQLNAISRRLITDQQVVGDLQKRLVDVKFMSATSEKLGKQEAEFAAKLADMEESTVLTEKIAAAVEPNLHYLRTKNVDLSPGINLFQDALSKTVKLLDGMAIGPADVRNVAESAENLASVNRDCEDLDEQIDKLHAMIPACEETIVAAAALKM